MIWPQKHENVFLRKIGVRERTFFCILPPPGHLRGPYFKVTARTNNGNPAVLFSKCCKPHLANWQKKMCLNSTLFRYSARSPHRATKPSQGWLRVVVRKLRLVLFELDRAGTKVTARARAYCRGCGPSDYGGVQRGNQEKGDGLRGQDERACWPLRALSVVQAAVNETGIMKCFLGMERRANKCLWS